MMQRVLAAVCLALCTGAARIGAQSAHLPPPDLILTGGKVFTADSTHPWAEALAIRGERILAVAHLQARKVHLQVANWLPIRAPGRRFQGQFTGRPEIDRRREHGLPSRVASERHHPALVTAEISVANLRQAGPEVNAEVDGEYWRGLVLAR